MDCWALREEQVNGWQMFPDIRLYFCDCKLGEELLPLPPQIPARNVSSVSNMWWILSFTLEITMGFPVSNFYPNQMAWVYRTRGPVHAWASSTTHSVDLSLHVKGFSDSHSFIAVGFLGAPRWSRRLSCYQQPGANRVKAVILESWWGGGGGICTWCLCAWDRFTASCSNQSALENFSPVTASKINMSSQNCKHAAKENSWEVNIRLVYPALRFLILTR